MVAQAKSSPQLIRFLSDVLEEEIYSNVFSEAYGEPRAYKDGKAHTAVTLLELLKGITDD